MKTSAKTACVAFGMAGALALLACSSDPAQSGAEGVARIEADRVTAPAINAADQAFAFFEATGTPGAYTVTAVNGATFACGAQTNATSCSIATIDLSSLDLDPTVASKIMRGVGADPYAPTLLFAGTISGDTLAVQEIWKAPEAIELTGTVLQVSHQPQQALVVNAWTATSVGTLDFSSAPEASYCGAFSDAGFEITCEPSRIPVKTDVVTPAGVLLIGQPQRNGSFRVEQYFLEITVGADQDGDGYSYCTDGETVCGSGSCSPSGYCLHWGGRTLVKIYDRSSDATFESWLLATGQLQPGDDSSNP